MKLFAGIVLSVCAVMAADNKLGKPLTLKEPMTVSQVLAAAPKNVGKTVQVKGRIHEVCQSMGCWLELEGEDGQRIRVKVNDGEIVFPKDSAGGVAVAEGTLAKIELTHEQAIAAAKHEAEEMGRPFDAASVKGGVTKYQIQGTGAVLSGK